MTSSNILHLAKCYELGQHTTYGIGMHSFKRNARKVFQYDGRRIRNDACLCWDYYAYRLRRMVQLLWANYGYCFNLAMPTRQDLTFCLQTNYAKAHIVSIRFGHESIAA